MPPTMKLLTCLGGLAAAGAAQAATMGQDAACYQEHATVYEGPKAGWQMIEPLQHEKQASHFLEAVEKIGLSQPLDTERGFTAFVPVDALFTKETTAGLLSQNTPEAQEFLSRHVVNQKISITLMRGTYERHQSVAGSELRLQRFGNRITVNSETIVETLKTPYGFVYLVDGFVEEPGSLTTAHHD